MTIRQPSVVIPLIQVIGPKSVTIVNTENLNCQIGRDAFGDELVDHLSVLRVAPFGGRNSGRDDRRGQSTWRGTRRPDDRKRDHGGDLNVDHGCVNRAVLIASRPKPGMIVPEIYAMEIPSSTEWAFQQVEPVFRPNVFFDITPTLEKKIEALGEYQQELRPFPHPRSPESVRNIARRWGSVAGCEAAEAFELIRAVR